ncbi:hypothetical protein Krac_3861 [Ktedonobacter racemifer DSM 44963]|uniref:Uncharacterized protein n=1 Tax=Ktedonobacter racemifer DSM 44963 TaxID=485913 RepID=D6U3H2_KTERA|nr:hypothetical protein Krac_3861 [Ktedonobacter racemifer DSM 44963]
MGGLDHLGGSSLLATKDQSLLHNRGRLPTPHMQRKPTILSNFPHSFTKAAQNMVQGKK